MVDFVKMIALAQRLITENGRSVTLIEFDATPDDVNKPWKGNADPRATPDASLTLDATFVSPGGAGLGLSAVSEDLIKRSEQIMIVSPGTSEDIRNFHEVVDGSENWKIVDVEILKPADEIVLSFIGVRR